MAVAGERGYPKKLDTLARVVGGEQKDSAGTRLINRFCKPNRSGERNRPEDYPEEWEAFRAYCAQDVETLRDVDRYLGWHVTETEASVYRADQLVNDRGIQIDVPMASQAERVADANQARQSLEVVELTDYVVENPGSNPQLLSWLQGQLGEDRVSNLQAATVSRLLSEDLPADARQVLELRQELALVASKKFSTALASVGPDGRLRGSFNYFGAHTGRWAGRGTQLQNLPREQFETEELTEDAIVAMMRGKGASALDLKRMVRALFVGPFTVVDYSSIEARVIAWLAGEQWALDAFADGRDIYVETAKRMSTPGRELSRSQGKVAVLALGYAGAVRSLRAMGAEGNDAQLMALVKQWRFANANIVNLWTKLADGYTDAEDVGEFLTCTHHQDTMGLEVRMHLPSGRAIHYHGVRWERYVVPDPNGGPPIRKEGYRYADPRDPFNRNRRVGTYGGRLSENATQAVARDLMAEAIVRLESAGYRVVGHVHDEVIVEGEHSVDDMRDVMVESPDWAVGLPVDGAGFTCRRYRKG